MHGPWVTLNVPYQVSQVHVNVLQGQQKPTEEGGTVKEGRKRGGGQGREGVEEKIQSRKGRRGRKTVKITPFVLHTCIFMYIHVHVKKNLLRFLSIFLSR